MYKIYKKSDKIDLESLLNGTVLLINKPIGWTSFDIIKKLRFIIKDSLIKVHNEESKNISIKKLKIGHAGTLDPFASGLLIIATGNKTKDIKNYQILDKTYEGEITIGNTTSSYDIETPPMNQKNYSHITKENIENIKQKFIGEINQKPPIYSAIKVKGERLYKQARKEIEVDIPYRKVFIKEFKIKKIDLPKIEFLIKSSKGTYIRSIAHNFGKELGVGGYLSKLNRTGIGSYKLKNAYKIEEIINFIN